MSTKEFSIAFTGPAVDEGSMDVSELAPALLALGDLFTSANRVLNGERASVRLHVNAEPRTACFEIDLQVMQTVASHFKNMLIGEGAVAAERLFDLLIKGGATGGGLFAFIKWVKKQKPSSTTQLDSNNVQITVNNETKVFPRETVMLYNDAAIRRSATRLSDPLRRERVENIEFREGTETVESVAVSDAEAFEPIEEPESTLSESERDAVLEVVTATFDKTRLWRMSDGSNVFNVGIEDEDFLQSVETGEKWFKKGEFLRVRLKSEQTMTPSGRLSTRYTVLRVLERVPTPEQIPFSYSES